MKMLRFEIDDGVLIAKIADLSEIRNQSMQEVFISALKKGLKVFNKKKKGSRWNRNIRIANLIKEYWQVESDEKIAMRIGVTGGTIANHRKRLGLMRSHNRSGSENKLIDKIKEIGTHIVENMLIRGGFSTVDILRKYQIRTSRERFRQLCVKLHIKHSPEDRVLPEWDIARLAHQQENMNLANKEWLNEQLQNSKGIADLAAQLAVDGNRLAKIIHLFKLTHPSFHKLGREVVELKCAGCGKKFKRLRRWVQQKEKMFPGSTYRCKPGCGNFGQGKFSARKKQERQMFVKEHWLTMTDKKLAKALKVGVVCIKRYRAELGLHYDTAGRPIPPAFQ